MKAKPALSKIRVNFGYIRGNNSGTPDFLLRKAKGMPHRVEIGRNRVGRTVGPNRFETSNLNSFISQANDRSRRQPEPEIILVLK